MTDRLTDDEIQELRATFQSWRFTTSVASGPDVEAWLNQVGVTVRGRMLSLLDELLEHRAREADSKHRVHFRDEDGRGFTVQSARWFGVSAKGFPWELEIYGTGDMGRGEMRRYKLEREAKAVKP